jgi:hypothetical protein
MKNISTLVPDILEVLSNNKPVKIDTQKLAEVLGARLSEDKGASVLRMSNLGTPCERKLWYSINKPELAEPLPPEARLQYIIGDISEEVVLSVAEQAGHTIKGRQDTVELHGVTGHRDAVIDGVVVDVKSTSPYGFEKFKDHKLETDDPFGYIDQLNMYREASKDDPLVKVKGEAAFLAVQKVTGKLALDRYKSNNKDYAKIVQAKRGMLAEQVPPKRAFMPEPDGTSGNMKLSVACSYCPFKKECWNGSNNGRGLRAFGYANGPRYLTHVAREPKEGLEFSLESNSKESVKSTWDTKEDSSPK